VDHYFKRYGDLDLQRRMVSDRRRTASFARALAAVVRPGDVVLDVGAGTGILSMLAARAGAARVYALEQAEIAEAARLLVAENGLADRVEVLVGEAGARSLPEPVDVLVSEWLGHLALVEGMLDVVLLARDRHLRPGGRLIPATVEVHLAPVDDPVLYAHDGPGFWREPVEGLDFSLLEALELAQARATILRVEPAALLARGATLARLELAHATPTTPWQRGRCAFEARRDGVLSGFVGWFVAELAPGIVLDTGPFEPETHWSQTYFPFPPRPVRRGERLELEHRLARDPADPRALRLELGLGAVTLDYRVE
jgi:SAM-dependent methyltransferase